MKKRKNKQIVGSSGFVVTTEPIRNQNDSIMKSADRDLLDELYFRVQEGDRTTEKELLGLKKKYPTVPMIGNYLVVFHQINGSKKKVEEMIEAHYKEFPKYLFARIQYAELCLRKGDIDKFDEIFEGKFSLDKLYPERDTFHISEYAAFVTVFCKYLSVTGDNKDMIKTYRDSIAMIDPDHPNLAYLDKLIDRDLFAVFKNMIEELMQMNKKGKKFT